MLAVRLYAPRDLRASQEPDPVPRPGESLLRVDAMGICGSDLHWFTEGGIGPVRLDRPVVPGHEMGGTIAAGPRRGERVALEPCLPCGRCRYCLAGWVNLCPTGRFSGQGDVDGGLRQLMAWPTHLLFPVPDMITDEQVPLLEPLLICLHADYLRPVRGGDRVAVVGCGPIGLLQIQVAALGGPSHILGVEPLAHRRDAALAFGASEAVAAAGPETAHDFDVVFEASGTPGAVTAAFDLCRPGGTVVLLGIPDEDTTTFTASTARRKGLTIMLVRRSVPVHERGIRLVEAGRIRLDGLVSHRFPLDRATEAFELAAGRQGLKVVIEPGAQVSPSGAQDSPSGAQGSPSAPT
jgi:L-iditol 2-dehydrogenase